MSSIMKEDWESWSQHPCTVAILKEIDSVGLCILNDTMGMEAGKRDSNVDMAKGFSMVTSIITRKFEGGGEG